MALTFPRDMPCPVTGDVAFHQRYNVARSVAGSADPVAVELAPSQWVGQWRLQLSRQKYSEWSAWVASLRGGLRVFKGRPSRRWPAAYPRGFSGLTVYADGTPFSGSGALASIGAYRDTATVNGLPATFEIRAGDYFSLAVGDRQHLYRVTEGATAALGAIALSFEPTLRPDIAIGGAVLFDGPWCDMVLSSDPSESVSHTGATITFEGIQKLL